jgi:enterochelin esterase family protein
MSSKDSLFIVMRIIAFAYFTAMVASAFCYAQEAAAFRSNEVHPDGSITFRYKDAGASNVVLRLEGSADPLKMEKDATGLWSVVTTPLAPEIYGYSFEADGQPRLDPKNTIVKPNFLLLGNQVTVPGKEPQPWDARNVPHGAVHHHFYTSRIVEALPNAQSDYYVYTPPNYDPKRHKPYPALYLLHGWSDLANGWTEVGQANFIFDNLLAEGKIPPMVVVMPLGYGDMTFVLGGHDRWNDNSAIDHNVDLFGQALLTEILPRVESEYHISKDQKDRAIAGLSMGGLESLTIGLSHPKQFAWVGGFSSALRHMDDAKELTKLNTAMRSEKTVLPQFIWIACGTEEELLAPNRKFIAWLKGQDIPLTAVETPGMHTWMVWRDNLIHFAPLLFQGK